MRKVTWRNLAARKIRLLLSAFAIVLGVAFVAGSLVFTDTMGKSFTEIISGTVSDVHVRSESSTDTTLGSSANVDARSMPASVVDDISALDGVERADGSVDGIGLYVLRKDGTLLGGTGAPTLSFNNSDAPNADGEVILEFVQGRAPESAEEVALDARSAELADYAIGDTVTMITMGEPPTRTAELVGIGEFIGGGTAGATLVIFDTPTAQDIFLDGADAFTSIAVTARDGVSQTELARMVGEVIPAGTEVITGADLAEENQTVVDTVLGFLNTFLLIFAAIALVVGTFLIVNTFSMLVAQRSRELALLRAMGASRHQVTRSVLTEAGVVGFIGSTLGLAAGFGLAAVLKALFSSFGLDLSGTSLVFSWRTVIVAYAVGILVTMVAAYLPARRASKISPVAAMRDDVAMPESSIHIRLVIGAVLAILGLGAMVLGLFVDLPQPAAWVGGGVFAVLMAIALTSPVLAVPVVSGAGVLFTKAYGSVGHLASENAKRNPRRTAATASALMIGLALVTTMSVLGTSVNRSIDAGVDEQFTSDFLVMNNLGAGFSTEISNDIAEVDGVLTVAPQQTVFLTVDGADAWASALDADLNADVWSLSYLDGSGPMDDNTIAVNESFAESNDLAVGDTVELGFPAGPVSSEVTGIFADSYTVGVAMIPFSTVEAAGLQRMDSAIGVNITADADPAAVADDLREAIAGFPMVAVQDKLEFAEGQRAQVNQFLFLIYALLGLAIVIAVLGIINTLALSVIERTREVGLLRAMGMTRKQLRRMVRLESIAIATLGALLGIGAGLLFGVVLQRAFIEQGITHLSIPVVQLVVFVVVSAVVGVLAAVLPARRAAKLDVLDAIATV